MKYRKSEAKEYAKEHIKGIWIASYTPFTPDYKIDEQGFRHNLRHFIDNLQIRLSNKSVPQAWGLKCLASKNRHFRAF